MNSDGTEQKQLTSNSVLDQSPVFSPDGNKIAFESRREDPLGEIYVMNTAVEDESNQPVNLTRDPADKGDRKPDWAPDAVKPMITLRMPVEGDTYTLNQSVTVDYECADEGGSGLASCVGDVSDGASVDTSSVGPKTFTVTATDNAGNTDSVTYNYNVVYNFSGFFSPVDNLPTLNVVKAGRAVPVKFSLAGDQGLDIFAEGYLKSQQISCDTSDPLDDIEQTVTEGSSSLAYDASLDQYSSVWKTDGVWTGTCRQLIVKFNDGTEYQANFKFK